MAPAVLSAGPPADPSMRADRRVMRPMTELTSTSLCARKATSTRASGSASMRSSRARAHRADSGQAARRARSRMRHRGGRAATEREGLSLVEGFRGDILVWVRLAPRRPDRRGHLRDPSWFQWPLLEAAIEGNIVADFPLCNKSFNCSYSGATCEACEHAQASVQEPRCSPL